MPADDNDPDAAHANVPDSVAANGADDVIRRYAARILALKAERDAAVDDATLLEIARELGMSDADVAAVAAAAAAHVVRARGYRDHGRLTDAVVELEQASALSPRDPATLFALADALKARFVAARDPHDAARARGLAKSCLAVAPDHSASFALLNELDQQQQQQQREQPRVAATMLPAVVFIGAVVFVVVGVVVAGALRSPVASTTAPTTAPITGPNTGPNTGPGVAVPPDTGGDTSGSGNGADSGNDSGTADLPVLLLEDHRSAGLRLDVRRSVLSRYPGSAFYELHAVIRSQRAALIERIDWRLELLDRAGVVVTTVEMQGPASHEGALRQGDAHALYQLVPTSSAATSVRLTPLRREEEPSTLTSTAPPSPSIELRWATPQPAGADIVVRERSRSVSQATFGLGPFLKATWEVENRGPSPLHLLKIEIRSISATGETLPNGGPFDSAQYVTAGSQPALRTGDVRLLRTTMTIPKDAARFELWVIEIQ